MRELREYYVKEYRIKTGRTLVCIERRRVSKSSKNAWVDMVVGIASQWFGEPVERITSSKRNRELVEIRQMVAKVLKSRCKCNSEVIAARLGNMERSTITNTLQRFELMYKTDKNYRQRFNEFNQHCTEKFNDVTSYDKQLTNQ